MDFYHGLNLCRQAIDALRRSGNLDHWFCDRYDYGRLKRVGPSLDVGAGIDESFGDEMLPIVTAAFRRFDGKPPSRNIGECCRDLIILASRKTLKP